MPAREVKAAAEADARKSDWIAQMNQLSEQTPAMATDRTENNAPRQVFLYPGFRQGLRARYDKTLVSPSQSSDC